MWLLFAAFTPLVPGLELGELDLSTKAEISDSKIVIVRIDPKIAKLRVLSANAEGIAPLSAGDWAKKYKLRAVINASMFEPGGASAGYMRIGKKENGHLTKDKALFAITKDKTHIFDRSCDPIDLATPLAAVQNIRMLGCKGENVWQASDKKWSTACVGEDKIGRILFIHVRSPLDVHDLVDQLLALPLDLVRLMYTEGGPEATLIVAAGGQTVTRIGSYETGFMENDENTRQWELPNVIGVTQ